MAAGQIGATDPFSILPDAFDDPLMRQWLCACAVFPGLRLSLTLQLGRRVAEFLGKKWPGEKEFMHIARLSWFREGRMPEDVRLALLERLDKKLEPKVREAIEEVIYNAVAEPELAFDRPDFIKPEASWRQAFTGFLRSRKPESRQYDVIYRQFMLGYRPGKLDLRIDDWARRQLGDRFSALIDLRSLLLGATALALALGLAFFPYDVGPTEERIVSSERTAELVELTDRLADGSPCPFCPRMIALPGASFVMGSSAEEEGHNDDEGPQHQVDVPAFVIGKFEVTVGQYRAFVEATDRPPLDSCRAWDEEASEWKDDAGKSWQNPGFEQTDDHPVACVSWEDATVYAAWLTEQTGQTYRLPSEAEWEFAARAGTITRYFWGDDEVGCDFANGADETAKLENSNWVTMPCTDGYYTTSPVGTFSPNEFGLFDLHGNVWEWVEDSWHESYEGAPQDGSPWVKGNNSVRVMRGGSWGYEPEDLRSAVRDWSQPDFRDFSVGFRLARTLTP